MFTESLQAIVIIVMAVFAFVTIGGMITKE
jgi:hypothetical protein